MDLFAPPHLQGKRKWAYKALSRSVRAEHLCLLWRAWWLNDHVVLTLSVLRFALRAQEAADGEDDDEEERERLQQALDTALNDEKEALARQTALKARIAAQKEQLRQLREARAQGADRRSAWSRDAV